VLNAEGIYGGCEGDVPSLISMCVAGELTGQPIFMANPSRILSDDNDIIFAHCTLPLNMPTSFELMTHFESDLGVAFRGHIQEGPVTIFKTGGLMQQYFAAAGELKENLKERNLCRTQVRIHLDEQTLEYFLTESIGNHHMIINGDWVELIDEFYKWF
jgi:L-fucose isomerase-like protein